LEFVNGVPTFQGTGGPGQGGRLTVIATEAILIAGQDSESFQSALASNAQFGSGRAGDLFIATPSLTMQGGRILAGTQTASSGDAGNLTLEVGRLVLTDGAQIDSSTSVPGQGGTVTVQAADAMIMIGPATGIFSRASGRGNAGQVILLAPTLQINEGAVIDSSTAGDGHGGHIAIQAQRIELSNGGTISTRSSGNGNAGNIVIQAGQIFQSRNGAVTTEAELADGGNILLIVGSLVELHDSQLTATVKSGVGRGGNITIDPQSVVLQRSQIRADAFGGPGGNVRIVAEVFLADPASVVSASSALGIAGTVDIRAPVTNLSGLVTPLPPEFAQVAALLRDRCAARLREGAVSSLVERGRDNVPANPDGVLPSRLYSGNSSVANSTSETTVSRQGRGTLNHKRHLQSRRQLTHSGSSHGQEPECAAQ
jgi:large exoprotein involved in heme utilization and adhesion